VGRLKSFKREVIIMNTRELKLTKLIKSAAWLCHLKAPKGVNRESWNKSIDDLFKANQLIQKMNNKGR